MDISTLTELWERLLGAAHAAPPSWLILLSGIVALAAVAHDPTWQVTRNVVTIAHEGGHAAAALVTGRQLQGIRLHSDTSGVTVSKGKPRGPGMVVTAAAGYVTPPLLGLGSAWLVTAGHVAAMLWTFTALLAAMLIVIRNAFGVVSVLVAGAATFSVSWFASVALQAAFAYLLTWFLLLAGLRPVLELQRKRRRRRAPDSDADQLARLTSAPGTLWVIFFAVIALGALLLGLRWLVPAVSLPW